MFYFSFKLYELYVLLSVIDSFPALSFLHLKRLFVNCIQLKPSKEPASSVEKLRWQLSNIFIRFFIIGVWVAIVDAFKLIFIRETGTQCFRVSFCERRLEFLAFDAVIGANVSCALWKIFRCRFDHQRRFVFVDRETCDLFRVDFVLLVCFSITRAIWMWAILSRVSAVPVE